MEKNKIIKKSRTSLYISIIGFIIVAAGFIAFFPNQVRLEEEITHVSEENISLKDSIKTQNNIIDSLKTTPIPIRIISVVSDYYRYRNLHQIDSIVELVTDPMERYYLETGASRKVVENDLETYWKRYPRSQYFIDQSSITITKLDQDNYEVEVFSLYTEDGITSGKVKSALKINAGYKIYFVRDMISDSLGQ